MIILNGKKIAEEMKEELKKKALALREKNVTPHLAVILAGTDPASFIYVKNKQKVAKELGITSEIIEFSELVREREIIETIQKLNADEKVHGILVQLPLPEHIDKDKILEMVNPQKDVDCFHPENAGRLFLGIPKIFPGTPLGIITLLERYGTHFPGKHCVVVGRSNIVGKPLSLMLLQRDATITMAHSKTKDLGEITRQADILISATGKRHLITSEMVKDGAVVVDVGMNRDEKGKLCGDVDFENVKHKVSAITPVPGGVGPMTIVSLMKNTVEAATLHNMKHITRNK